VAYSHFPSGDTARPTGASPVGICPARLPGPNPLVSAWYSRKTAITALCSMLTKAYRPSRDTATSMAPPAYGSASVPSTGSGAPDSARATLTTIAALLPATSSSRPSGVRASPRASNRRPPGSPCRVRTSDHRPAASAWSTATVEVRLANAHEPLATTANGALGSSSRRTAPGPR